MDPGGRVNAVEQKVWCAVTDSRRTPRHGIWPCRAGKWTNLFAALCQRGGNLRTDFLGVPAKALAEGSSIARARVLAGNWGNVFSSSGAADGASPYLSGYEGSACTDTCTDDGGTSRFGVDVGSHRRRSGETSGTLGQRCFWPSARPRSERRRIRRSPRRRTKSQFQRSGQTKRGVSRREGHWKVTLVKQQLGVLPGEAWSFSRYNEQMVQSHCGHFKTLRRMLAAVAAGRTSDRECRKSDGDDESFVSRFGSRDGGSSAQSRMGMALVGSVRGTSKHATLSTRVVRSASTKKPLPTKKQNVESRVRPVRPCLRPRFPTLQGCKPQPELASKAS